MTTIEQLQAQITEMQKQLDELKEQDKAQTGGWTPEIGEGYYYLDADGDISEFMWEDKYTEKQWLSQGSIFKTRSEAEKERDRRAVTKKLRDLAGGYKFMADEKNWNITYDHEDEKWEARYAQQCQMINNIYFQTEESARHAIDVLGDELNKLL